MAPGEPTDETDTHRAAPAPQARQGRRGPRRQEDHKLQAAIKQLDTLVGKKYSPIVFCRFIPTVDYLVEALRKHFKGKVEVRGVTGQLANEAREAQVAELAEHEKRILVATDCLSEGVNLQSAFDAVMHYDLAWNPTRHEQREGRVDRYGQEKKKVRVLTFVGEDNPVDGIVQRVLLKRHETIMKVLGVSVPVPLDTGAVLEAVIDGLLKGGVAKDSRQYSLPIVEQKEQEVGVVWEAAAEREKKNRTLFAQHAIDVKEVATEVAAARQAVGGAADVRAFTMDSLRGWGAGLADGKPVRVDLEELPKALRETLAPEGKWRLKLSFDSAAPTPGTEVLTRTHPFVAALAERVLEAALDSASEGPARRAAVIRTRAVSGRCTALLVRMRFHLVVEDRQGVARPLLAEDVAVRAFRGTPDAPEWLDDDEAEALLGATADENLPADMGKRKIEELVGQLPSLDPALAEFAKARAEALLEAHRRVRKAADMRVRATKVEAHLPPDVLGTYLFFPVTGGAA